MALRKCPRCELNYILDDGALCTVCREEVHGQRHQSAAPVLCAICGDVPPRAGEDLCPSCLAEMRAIERAAAETDRGSGDGDDAGVATGHLEAMQEADDLDGDDEGSDASDDESAGRADGMDDEDAQDGDAGDDDTGDAPENGDSARFAHA